MVLGSILLFTDFWLNLSPTNADSISDLDIVASALVFAEGLVFWLSVCLDMLRVYVTLSHHNYLL